MLQGLIKIACTYPETRVHLLPIIRRHLQANVRPWGWQKFLDAKYQGGKELTENPNPDSRDYYPQVEINTALEYEEGRPKHPVWDRLYKEYMKWLAEGREEEKKREQEKKAPSVQAPKKEEQKQVSVAPEQEGAFTKKINVANPEGWKIEGSILDATTSVGGTPTKIDKFSWNPVTGEFLLVHPSQQHSSVKGKAPFDDYVRGIIFRNKKEVAFRPFRPTWLEQQGGSSLMQQFHGGGSEQKAVMNSIAAQEAAEKALKENGAEGWSYRKNITNKMLAEETGYTGW